MLNNLHYSKGWMYVPSKISGIVISKTLPALSAFIVFIFISNQLAFATVCSGFRTQTQGGWGADPHGGNPGVYLHDHFASAFPGGLTIGCGGNTLTLSTAQDVTDFLPSGSTPSALPSGNTLNPGESYNNVFAAQLVTATLNVGFDNTDATFSSNSIHTQDLYITSGIFTGWTISQLIAQANSEIGGCSSTYSLSDLNDALDDFNNNYDDGTQNQGFLSCTPPVGSLSIQCSSVNGTCANGKVASASVSATGGTTPYTYSWSNGATTSSITNLAGGTYTVTVNDAAGHSQSCTSTVTVISCCNVTNPGEISGNEAHCGSYDPSAISSVSGGSGGVGVVKYEWRISTDNFSTSNVIAGATNSTYDPGTITQTTYYRRGAKSDGCTDYLNSNIITKTVYNNPSAICTPVDGNCSNNLQGSVSVSASGGTPDYTYAWSNGATTSSIEHLPAGPYSVIVTDAHSCTATCSSNVSIASCCNVTNPGEISGNEAHCGSYDASAISSVSGASGGVGAVQYEWLISTDNFSTFSVIAGATNSTYDPGVITQTTYYRRGAKSEGCNDYVVSNIIVKTVYGIPVISCSSTDGDCHNEFNANAGVTVDGGTGPFSYTWSNGQTTSTIDHLESGSYTVIVTDIHNCADTCSSTVTKYTPVTVDQTHVNVSIHGGNDGSINITPNGGTSPYTYLWNDGATTEDRTQLSPNTYSVVVTDAHGCTGSATITIEDQPCNLTVNAGPDVSKCHGATTQLNATASQNEVTYSWSPTTGLNNSHIANPISSALATTTYTVTVTAPNGCTASDAVVVTVYLIIKSKIKLSPNHQGCGAQCVKLQTPYNAGWTWVWKKDGVIIPGATNYTYCACQSGSYRVWVSNSYGCLHVSAPYVVNIPPQKLDEPETQQQASEVPFTVWPNPATTLVYVSFSNKISMDATIQLVDISGRILATKRGDETTDGVAVSFDTNEVAPGMYFVELLQGNTRQVKKVIITR